MKFNEFEEGLKLLQENGDCTVCFNDCHKGWCLSKFTWTCRVNEEGKGCSTGHVSHEYFYKGTSKSAFSMKVEAVLRSDTSEYDVLLQVMKIPQLDRKGVQVCPVEHRVQWYVHENRAWEKDEFSMSRKEVAGLDF